MADIKGRTPGQGNEQAREADLGEQSSQDESSLRGERREQAEDSLEPDKQQIKGTWGRRPAPGASGSARQQGGDLSGEEELEDLIDPHATD